MPSYEEVGEDEPLGEGISAGRADRQRDSSDTALAAAAGSGWPGAATVGPGGPAVGRHTAAGSVGVQVALSPPSPPSPPRASAPGHPLSAIVSRLWSAKPPGAAVELHLRGGEVLVVEELVAPGWQGSYGAFAVREPDGKFRLIVLAWDAVELVAIGGVEKLPQATAG